MTDDDRPERPLDADAAFATVARALGRIAPEVDLATADRQAPLQDELDLDSMDLLNLVTALSEQLAIDIPDADMERLTSLDALVAYLVERTTS